MPVQVIGPIGVDPPKGTTVHAIAMGAEHCDVYAIDGEPLADTVEFGREVIPMLKQGVHEIDRAVPSGGGGDGVHGT